MNKKERLIEGGKTLLIVFLLITTVLLLKETDYYSRAFELLGDGGNGQQSTENISSETVTYNSAYPLAFSVSVGEGNRYASIYDRTAVESDYQRFSAALGEALGSAGKPIKVDKSNWKKALARESVYIRFYSPQSLSILAGQLGTVMSSSAAEKLSAELCLSCYDDSTKLFFKSGDGEYFSCETAVSVDVLRSRIAEYLPNGSGFSNEYELLTEMEDIILIPGSMPEIYTVTAGSTPSQTKIAEMLFEVLGLNEFTASKYTESDGTVVYLDNSGILSVSPSGVAEYSNDGKNAVHFGGSGLEAAQSLAWKIVNSSIAAVDDDAGVFLSKMEFDESSGDFVFCFDYEINGIPLVLNRGYACMIQFVGAKLTSAEFYFQNYYLGQDTVQVLPVYQAAAIAAEKGMNGIKLVYSESTDGINCIWVNE